MPWTFSHAAAVLPLRRLCPGRLNFAALAIGSMTPDLGYYLRLPDLAPLAHSLLGSLLFCLPAGLALLTVISLLRRPLWFILPQPHREALAPLALAPLSFRPAALSIAGISVWLGTLTHIAWDAFTHKDGWMVTQLPPLRELLWFAASPFPVYYLLQQVSTLLGAMALAIAYWAWLRDRIPQPFTGDTRDERLRYALIGGIATIALAIAVPLALEATASSRGFYAIRVFMFNLAIDATAAFLPLFTLGSVLFYVLRGRGPSASGQA